ncbi:MAG: GNAT family N-acetyltransferase [Alphaproteobacteria bacterium]
MASIDDLRRVDLETRHIADACELVAEAGWNQTPDDWHLFLKARGAVGFEDESGRLVAASATIPHGPEFGWVSMVLVTEKWRRMGIATHLLKACIAHHQMAGRIPLLDATPDGEKLYAGFGFRRQFGMRRWQRGSANTNAVADKRVRHTTPDDAANIIDYDRSVFGGDRSPVLRDLLDRQGARGWIMHDGRGFLLSRRGRFARQIGPLCANDEETALRLAGAALSEVNEPLIMEVPDRHERLIETLAAQGFSSRRRFWRMAMARGEPFGDMARMFAPVGPEFG